MYIFILSSKLRNSLKYLGKPGNQAKVSFKKSVQFSPKVNQSKPPQSRIKHVA